MPAARFRDGLSVLFVLMLVLSSGCVSQRQRISAYSEPPTVKELGGPDVGWWKAGFFVEWPEDVEPLWHVDLLLAHRVIRPVLRQFENDIVLWRFHRRAMRDETGHQFSFIFYSSGHTAQKVFDAIQTDSVLQAVKASGAIIKDVYDDTGRTDRPHVEDASDPGWPEAIRKSWPYFIMGVSQTWLDMVALIAKDTPACKTPMSVEETISFYKKIDGSVEALWQETGGHAFLHHLNAIFGYEDVFVYEQRLMTF